MGDNEQKAMALMAEAEKKLTAQKGFFGSLFGCVWIFIYCDSNILIFFWMLFFSPMKRISITITTLIDRLTYFYIDCLMS